MDDSGKKIMPCNERDNIFARNIRNLTGARISRFEAFTFVRTRICDIGEWNLMKKLIATKKHMDGPNDGRNQYRHTGIYSFLCTWNNGIYRMTLIVYTRASCGNWMGRNFLARSLRQKLQDYSTEYNGRKNYTTVVLADQLEGEVVVKPSEMYSYFVPPKEYVSEAYLNRNQDSMWKIATGYSNTTLKWRLLPTNWQRHYGRLLVIAVPEFPNRFGFVSAFAHQINEFISKHNPSRVQTLELLYVAILSTSPVTFYYVMQKLIDFNESELQHTSLFRKYIDLCAEDDLVPNGGAMTRYQPQPYSTSMKPLYEDPKELSKNLTTLDTVLEVLENGGFLNLQGELLNKPTGGIGPTDLHAIGKVSATSFASLAVFTGLATSVEAISTARICNCNNMAGYYKPMHDFTQQCYAAGYPKEGVVQLLPHNFEQAWRAIGKSLGELVCTLENWCCATFRSNHKYDVFFQGQTMYNLTDGSNIVKVKLYGSSEWIDKLYETDNVN